MLFRSARRLWPENERSILKETQAFPSTPIESQSFWSNQLAHCGRLSICAIWYIGCCTCINLLLSFGSCSWFISKEIFYALVAMGKRSFSIVIFSVTQTLSHPVIRVSCEPGIDEQILGQNDGTIQTRFPDRLILISNHQIEIDWIFMWWTAFTNRVHGHIHMLAKECVRFFPCMYPATLLFGFAFLSRKWKIDERRLQCRLKEWNTRRPDPAVSPMWLLIYPEGTTLSRQKRKTSSTWADKRGVSDFNHLLLPRSTGLFYCLRGLRGSLDWLYDCTIAYDGVMKGEYALEKFDLASIFLRQRGPKSIHIHWRRYALSRIPMTTSADFEAWLMDRWKEKEILLENFYTTGHFIIEPNSMVAKYGGRKHLYETCLGVGLFSRLEIGQTVFIFLILAITMYSALTNITLPGNWKLICH